MSGILGSANLYVNTPQTIYVCNKTGGAIVSLSVCNRNNKSVYINASISDTLNDPASDEWIEYGVELKGYGVLERSSLALSQGQQIIVTSSDDNVNAVVWGHTIGEEVLVTPITTNDEPPWNNAIPTIYAGESTQVYLTSNGANPFSGTFSSVDLDPASGLSINSASGLLSGTPNASQVNYSPIGSTVTFNVTATVPSGNFTNTFNIIKRWKDGSTRELAGTSGSSIKSMTGTTTDGSYWIKPAGCPEAFQVHCYMSIEGGGWMLTLRNTSYELGHFGSQSFLVSDWAGWGYNTKSQIDSLGFNYALAEDNNCFTPVYAYSNFSDVMVIANRAGQQSKRVGWRHLGGFNNMYTVLSTPSEKVATSTLFGDPYRWLQQLDVRSDTNAMGASGTLKVGFKIRSDTGSYTSAGMYVGGFHTDAMHYGSMIGCGRDNSNSNEWGGGFGGHYNGSGRYHRLNGHWWGHGDGRSNAAWTASDRSSAFWGHAVYIR